MNKLLDSLHKKILKSKFAEEVTEAEIDALVEAKENNCGWIPCSERLPDEEDYYLITMKYYHLHNPVVMGCNFEEGEWWNVDKDDEVIAWMPLPPAYVPKEGRE